MRCVLPPMGRVQPPPLLFSCISMQTGRVQPPSPLFSTTALKNEQTHLFLRAVVVLEHLSWHHQHPPPSKTSKHARFRWRWLLFRPTVPHHPRKCSPPPTKTSIRAHFHWRFFSSTTSFHHPRKRAHVCSFSQWLFSRPTTVPHHPRKRAYMLVFVGGGCSPSKQDETPSVGVLLCSSPSHAQ